MTSWTRGRADGTSSSPLSGDPCCAEYAAVSRRGFIGGAMALAGTTSVIGSAVLTASPATAAAGGNVLVVLSMRGAADGMSLVVPHSDPNYYAARPGIAVAPDSLLVRNAMFGLHPSLAPLLPLWQAGKMATVHAAGLPVANRSHFSAMEELEDAAPGSSARVGWLNRMVGTTPGSGALQGFAVGSGVVPTSLVGPESSLSAGRVDDVSFAGDDQWDADHGRMPSLHTMWDTDSSTLGTGMRAAFGAVGSFTPATLTTDQRASFPNGDLGEALSTASRVVRGDVGVEVITVDHGNWDMHTDIGNLTWGRMKNNATELAAGIAAFFTDLGPAASRVTLVALSEFGRRVRVNSNGGLDHGFGSVMMAFGAGVTGGYYGRWPGVSTTEDADLLVTTDYRDVLADVVAARFNASIPTVFPGLQRTSVGFMRS